MADTPSEPVVDFDRAKQNATNVFNALTALAAEWNVPPWLGIAVGAVLAFVIAVISFIALFAIQSVIQLGSWAVAQFLTLIGQAREDNEDALNEVLASSINELLGTKLDGGDLQKDAGTGSTADQNQAVGNAVINLLAEQFGGLNPVTPEQGASNAKQFAGFGINFATTQGFISLLAEACSLGYLNEVRELPEALMRGLGISRLQRTALQPLIHNAIAMPYDRYMKAKMRPTSINPEQAEKAARYGLYDQGDVETVYQEHGYTDEDMAALRAAAVKELGIGELWTLYSTGALSDAPIRTLLQHEGYSAADIDHYLAALDESHATSHWAGTLAFAQSAVVAGRMTQADFTSLINRLPLSNQARVYIQDNVTLQTTTPRKVLSFGDVKSAIATGLVDFSYLDTWMQHEGYDEESQTILTYQVLQAIEAITLKEKSAAFRAAALKAKNKPIPPWLEPQNLP